MPRRPPRTTARPDSGGRAPETRETGSLNEYRAKRDFSASPEPDSASSSSSREGVTPAKKSFVVQKHDATRVHYDVRLEVAGAMVSWAVPKGPSYDPNVKRLAVEVEDHPVAYAGFEGRIPDGHYGAGDVLVWDRGSYETIPPGEEEAMRAKGHFKVMLFGEKLRGAWHLVRTSRRLGSSGKAQWLFFKAQDADANATLDVVSARPESVVTGRRATRGPGRVTASDAGKTAHQLLLAMGEVARATSGPLMGDGSDYHFEIKFDGYRLLVGKAGGEVRLFTRKQNDWTERFKGIAAAVAALPAREVVVDGEACAVDDAGRPSFEALQQWLAGEKTTAKLAFAAFDLLWLDGRDLRKRPIEERRELLEALLRGAKPPLSFSTALGGGARLTELLAAAKRAGLEGLVAKRRGSPYAAGASTHWVKLKFERRQEAVVCGYTPMSGATTMGALILGVREQEGGPLVYAGKVGTGFDARMRRDFARRLDAGRRATTALTGAVPRIADAIWCEPRIVVEIGFVEWTRDGSPRHPRYLGLREDKEPADCVREAPRGDREAPPPVSARATGAVKLSNPDKVLYPRDRVTKQMIFDYYTEIAPAMLPHLRGRPINMQRWPDGIDAEEWFQHRTPPKAPEWVRRLPFVPAGDAPWDFGRHGKGVKERIVVENVETLQWVANLAALTLHAFGSHVPPTAVTREEVSAALGLADYVCIDLDPGERTTWEEVIRIAHAVRTLLEALHLESFPKTSGKRGLHVILPFARGPSHREAVAFGEQIARAVAKVLPDIATIERVKEKRRGRCYVDYGQNGEHRTLVAPYSLRAVDGAPVATPLAWGEVTDKLEPRRLGMREVLARVAKEGDLFAPCLAHGQALPRLA